MMKEIRLVKLDGKVRKYLLRYEKKSLLATITPDDEGKVASLGLRPN